MQTRHVILLAALLLLTACSTKGADGPVRDLVELQQDAGAYHGLDPHAPILSPMIQAQAYAHFLSEHFAPWNRTEPKHTAEEVFWGFKAFGEKELFGENTLLRDPTWVETMRFQSQIDSYPTRRQRVISVTNTSMRVFPTNHPAFYSFARAGEGYPFDYMQNSLVLAGTPLFATHESADKAWILVESRFAYGWVPARDIAWADDEFVDAFTTGTYGAITKDDVTVTDRYQTFRFKAHIGTILPAAKMDGMVIDQTYLIPVRSSEGNAMIREARLPLQAAHLAPLATTPANFTRLANAMLGRQYGWGGLYEDRDCSATTMDLMAAFGIFLPRNSVQQYKYGNIFGLDGLSRPEKKKAITSMATPFLTLVRKRGHIMLYVGQQEGAPIVLHSVWGLKTIKGDGYGRKIIGSTVITSLEPGIELNDLARPKGILLETVYGISTLPGSMETGE